MTILDFKTQCRKLAIVAFFTLDILLIALTIKIIITIL